MRLRATRLGAISSGGRATAPAWPGLSLNGAPITDLTAPIALSAASTVTGGSGASYTLSGPISGAYSLTIAPDGGTSINLAAANAHSGTAVSSGTLQAGNAAAFGAAGSVSVAAGATLDLGAFSTARPITLAGGTLAKTGAGTSTTTTISLSAPSTISPSAGSLLTGSVVAAGNDLTIAGSTQTTVSNITSSGASAKLTVTATSAVTLINGAASGLSAIDLPAGSTNGCRMNGNQGLINGGTVTIPITVGAGRSLQFAGINTGSGNTLVGNISGEGGLAVLSCTAPTTLDGVHTYTGGTSVNQAPLVVTGSVVGSSVVLTNSANSKISGGNATTGTVGPLTFNSAVARLVVNAITTTSCSKLTCGALTAAGGFTVDVLGAMNAGTYPILVSASGTPAPTLGANTTGRAVSFAWSGQTLNMTLT